MNTSERSQGDPAFLAALDLLRGLHLSKGADYADRDDPLRNYAQSGADNGLPAWRAAQLRLSEKYHRLINLTRAERDPEHESLDDTLLDIAALALIVRSLRKRGDNMQGRQPIATAAKPRHLLASVCKCSQQADGCGQ